MREIKFRGLADDGEWYYGYYCINRWDEHTIFGNDFAKKVRPETIGQFTGLLDKDGKEIWEADLVKTDYGKTFQIVYYKNGFYLDDGLHSQFNEEKIVVVGNVNENPSLVDIAK